MLLTITILGVKWYWILLVAGVVVYHLRYKTGTTPNPDEIESMGEDQYSNFNEARFKTFKKVTDLENAAPLDGFKDDPAKITITDDFDKDGEFFTVRRFGKLFTDAWHGSKPTK